MVAPRSRSLTARLRRGLMAVLGALLLAAAPTAPAAAGVAPQVVGGQPAAPGQIPFQAALFTSSGYFFCAGVLIGPQRVVTPATCVDGTSAAGIRVRVNTVDASAGPLLAVASVVIHPAYSATTGDHDLAVLRLATAATATPALLPEAGSTPAPGTVLRISGWGTRLSPADPRLLWADIPVVNAAYCAFPWPLWHFCAGSQGRPNACGADFGGPAVTGRTLRGLIGYHRAPCDRPSGYLDVARYVSWLSSV